MLLKYTGSKTFSGQKSNKFVQKDQLTPEDFIISNNK